LVWGYGLFSGHWDHFDGVMHRSDFFKKPGIYPQGTGSRIMGGGRGVSGRFLTP